MKTFSTTACKVLVARCDVGEDLYTSLTKLVSANNVSSGHFQVMGAVSGAKVGIFESGKYEWTEHKGAMEISSCIGNVTLKEGKPFIHCHAVFTDHHGNVVAGHITEGCIVNPTAEIHLTVHENSLERSLDENVNLWTIKI